MYREFEEYVFNNFNTKEENISRKYYHSKRVAILSKKIAENEGYSLHDVRLCMQIGLLHDIGRFYEWTFYHSFRSGFDHGSFGVYLLNDKDFYHQFDVYESDEQDLFDAIYYHNKLKLPLKLKNNKFCNVIRDADKLDILYQATQEIAYKGIKTNIFSKKVIKEFNNSKPVNNKNVKTYADIVIKHLGFIYDIKYDYTLKTILDLNYLDKIYNNLEEKELYKDYFIRTKKYIERRLKINDGGKI